MPPQGSAVGLRQLAAQIQEVQRRYEEERDERAIFACVYGKITADLAAQIETPGAFDDADW